MCEWGSEVNEKIKFTANTHKYGFFIFHSTRWKRKRNKKRKFEVNKTKNQWGWAFVIFRTIEDLHSMTFEKKKILIQEPSCDSFMFSLKCPFPMIPLSIISGYARG